MVVQITQILSLCSRSSIYFSCELIIIRKMYTSAETNSLLKFFSIYFNDLNNVQVVIIICIYTLISFTKKKNTISK